MRAKEVVTKKAKYLHDINRAVQSIINQVPEAEEIWLHGSRARGDQNPLVT
jgi:predicted nucleotidyltransferase